MRASFRTNPVDSVSRPCWFVFILVAYCLFLAGCRADSGQPVSGQQQQELEEANTVSGQPSANDKRGGELTAAPEVFEGKANAGDETVDVTFTLTNDLERPVKITKLDSTCTCLSVEVQDTELAPGESTTLNAVFEIEKLLGKSEKLIEVYTDVRDRPQFLPVQVSVPPIYELEPKNIVWKLKGESKPKKFVFKTLRDKPIQVVSVRSSRKDLVDATFKEVIKGKEYEITVTPKNTDDFLLGFVTIETDLEIENHKNVMGFYTISDSE